MSAVPVDAAATLAGGEWLSGFTVAITSQMIWQYGLSVGVWNDRKRQTLLNLLCLICAINTTISYGYNATKASVEVIDVTTMITFISVQYGLVVLNHNTLVRAANLWNMLQRKNVDRIAISMYILPVLVLIPAYYGFADTAGTGKPMNSSSYNSKIYKPINIALLVATEILATVTDIMLLVKLKGHKSDLEKWAKPNPQENARVSSTCTVTKVAENLSSDLCVTYCLTWALIIVDVAIKVLIANGIPVLFDSIVSVAAIAMRSRANLQYGLELQNLMNPQAVSVYNAGFSQRQVAQTSAIAAGASDEGVNASTAVIVPQSAALPARV